jgi:hypothetical protein
LVEIGRTVLFLNRFGFESVCTTLGTALLPSVRLAPRPVVSHGEIGFGLAAGISNCANETPSLGPIAVPSDSANKLDRFEAVRVMDCMEGDGKTGS